jgi:hypothetical protein
MEPSLPSFLLFFSLNTAVTMNPEARHRYNPPDKDDQRDSEAVETRLLPLVMM